MSGPFFHKPNRGVIHSRWRCYRCNQPEGLDFDSPQPVCPQCQAQPPAVLRLTDVHFLAPDGYIPGYIGSGLSREGFDGLDGFKNHMGGTTGELTYRCACAPNRRYMGHDPATNEPSAVTCPRCMMTPVWQMAMDAYKRTTRKPGQPQVAQPPPGEECCK